MPPESGCSLFLNDFIAQYWLRFTCHICGFFDCDTMKPTSKTVRPLKSPPARAASTAAKGRINAPAGNSISKSRVAASDKRKTVAQATPGEYQSTAEIPLETRSIILHCAARLLRENGYAAVSLRQIAQEAGIRASTIYYHGLLQVGDFSSANIRIYGQVPEDVRLRHARARSAYGKWWSEFLREGVDEGAISPKLNLGVARVFIVGSLNWTVEWYDPKRGSFADFADHVCSIISSGLVQK